MTTDAVAVLPNVPPAGTAYGDGSRSARSDADAARTNERSPVERADTHKTDAAEQDCASRQNNRADQGHSRFEETLKQRLEREAPDKENAEKGKGGEETEAAQAVVIFQAPSRPPISIKPIAADASKTLTTLKKDIRKALLKAHVSQEKITAAGVKAEQRTGVQVPTDKATAESISTADTTKEVAETQKAATSSPYKGGRESLKDGRNTLDGMEKQTDPTGDQKASTSQPPKADTTQGRPMADNNTENKPFQADKAAFAAVENKTSDAKSVQATENATAENKSSDAKSVQKTQHAVPRESSLKAQDSEVLDSTKPGKIVSPNEAEPSVFAASRTSDTTSSLSAAAAHVSDAPPPASSPSPPAVSQVDTAKGVTDASSPRPIEQIVQQLQLRTIGGDSQVRMTLSPEELGAIRITFRQVNSEIVGVLEAQRTETRQELERSITQLTASMETAGLQIRRIEVVPWSANNQAARNDSSNSGFDAATEREMYRPSSDGLNASQNKSQKGVMEDLIPSPADWPTTPDSFGEARTGLNFYL